jgi:hypothetical protein
MLKRPVEKHWNWRAPPEPFPPTPGASGGFIAPSGGGKTTTMISLILGPYKGVFNELHIYSPSVHLDSAYDVLQGSFAKSLDDATFHEDFDMSHLSSVLERQKHKIQELKKATSHKYLPQVLVIIDDFADRPDVIHQNGNIFATLFTKGGHYGVSTWVSSRKLRSIATTARVNFRFACIWRLRNQKEIDSLLEELSALHPVKTLRAMYEQALEESFSFWYINFIAKKKSEMFHVRFDYHQVLGEEETKNDDAADQSVG